MGAVVAGDLLVVIGGPLACGAFLWWVARRFAATLTVLRITVDRAVLESLAEGPPFSHALAEGVRGTRGLEGVPEAFVRASGERLERRGLAASRESGFLAPPGPGRDPEPRRVYSLTCAGQVRASQLGGSARAGGCG